MEPMFRLRERYAQKAAPAWSWLVATLNDPNLIAVVLFCLISLLVTAGRLRWNEWYVATHPLYSNSSIDVDRSSHRPGPRSTGL